jgi:outer membrane immunogenic protein
MRPVFFSAVAVAVALSARHAHAGEAPLAPGRLELNAGLGLGRAPLPVYVGVDVAVHRDVTLGGTALVSTGNASVAALGRVDYHWNRLLGIPRDGDFYLGAGVLLSGSGLYPRIQLGGRWFWNERMGLNLELGGAAREAGGLFGLTVKLN